MINRSYSSNDASEPSTKKFEFSGDDNGLKETSISTIDSETKDLCTALSGISFLELEGAETPLIEANEQGFSEIKTPKTMKTRTLSLDGATADSVANDFLSMLGIEHSPFGLSSDSDPESLREHLWKQFEKDSFKNEDIIFGFDIGEEEEFTEDLDLSSIIHEAEKELERETHGVDIKSRAKMLEDEETEAFMCEWGLNERAFQNSPPGSFDARIRPLPSQENAVISSSCLVLDSVALLRLQENTRSSHD